MKVFVTGVNGQLGRDCVNDLISRIIWDRLQLKRIWMESRVYA